MKVYFSLCLIAFFQNGADFFSWGVDFFQNGADFLKNLVDFFSWGVDFLAKVMLGTTW